MANEHEKGLMERILAAQEAANEQAKRFEQLETERQRAAEEERAHDAERRAEHAKANEKVAADRERLIVAAEQEAAAMERIADYLQSWDLNGVPSRGGP